MNALSRIKTADHQPTRVKEISLYAATGVSIVAIPFFFNPITLILGTVGVIASVFALTRKKSKIQQVIIARRILEESLEFYFDTYGIPIIDEKYIKAKYRSSLRQELSENAISESLKNNNEFHAVIPAKTIMNFRSTIPIITKVFAVHYADGVLKLQTLDYELKKFNANFVGVLSKQGNFDEILMKASETYNEKRHAKQKSKKVITKNNKQALMDRLLGYSDDDDIFYDTMFRKNKKTVNLSDRIYPVFSETHQNHSKTIQF